MILMSFKNHFTPNYLSNNNKTSKPETKRFVSFIVSGSSHVVANIMVTGGLYGR
jgi:hypothetical protein